ncbi:hypothetical protein T4B_11097 [Trichinella pseudospiralis]|uniref:Uncharacterized protein n=1 Tax=Trichinella pseudospiralis TaxID=6337 RepID=A0A0V1IAG5_TRIPS|nr:hypothetical protein T4B_11097 [Trichinella pseudospiralis]
MNKAHHLLNNCVRYAGDFYRHSERMLKSVHFAVNGPFVEMLSTKILIQQHKKNNTNVNNQESLSNECILPNSTRFILSPRNKLFKIESQAEYASKTFGSNVQLLNISVLTE